MARLNLSFRSYTPSGSTYSTNSPRILNKPEHEINTKYVIVVFKPMLVVVVVVDSVLVFVVVFLVVRPAADKLLPL